MACLVTLCTALALMSADTGEIRPAPSSSPQEPIPAAGPVAPAAPLLEARMATTPPGLMGQETSPLLTRPDTTPRAAPFEYSDAYGTRLTIHRIASYATIPLFVASFASGSKMLSNPEDAPGWARSIHGPAAAGVGALFAVNTVTGGLNLWEARKDPEGRTRRTVHGLLMLAADAGFTATGLLAGGAEDSQSRRDLHRTVALSSMGVSLVSYAIMLPWFGGGK